MGHLDVWAYVIQSQCAASNGPTIAEVLLRADRSAAKPPQHGPPWPRQPEPPGPEVCISHSLRTPHTPDTPLSISQLLSHLKEMTEAKCLHIFITRYVIFLLGLNIMRSCPNCHHVKTTNDQFIDQKCDYHLFVHHNLISTESLNSFGGRC